MKWGKKGHRIWIAKRSRRRFMWRNHDALYVAVGRLRVRIWKPGSTG